MTNIKYINHVMAFQESVEI